MRYKAGKRNGLSVSDDAYEVGRIHVTVLAAFESRCCKKLEGHGDIAMDTQQYNEAISRYSVALSLNPAAPQDLFVKRSKAYLAGGSWKEALHDANEVHPFLSYKLIPVDRLSPGHPARSIVAVGLPAEACCST